MLANPASPHASVLTFRADNGKVGTIRWWRGSLHWHWTALGNSGTAGSEKSALESARSWIRNGKC